MDQQQPLTLNDHCDRCGVPALARTQHEIDPGKMVDLLWCGHHYRQHEDALAPYLVRMETLPGPEFKVPLRGWATHDRRSSGGEGHAAR